MHSHKRTEEREIHMTEMKELEKELVRHNQTDVILLICVRGKAGFSPPTFDLAIFHNFSRGLHSFL